MSLSDKQLKDVCLLHGGSAQCRYLQQSPNSYSSFECGKNVGSMKAAADKKVKNYLAICAQTHADPHLGWTSIGNGNNCGGFLYLPTVKQGYDLKRP